MCENLFSYHLESKRRKLSVIDLLQADIDFDVKCIPAQWHDSDARIFCFLLGSHCFSLATGASTGWRLTNQVN